MTEKEKFDKAKRLYQTANADQKYVLEILFPELKESEEKKVKRILHSISSKMSFHLHDIFTEEEFQCFDAWSHAWLEKQGIQRDINPTLIEKEKMDDAFTKMMFKGKTALEAINEETVDNVNKVEPKFKVGDWIVFNGLVLFIKEVVQGYYRTISVGGIPNSYDWDIDNVARLWTIDDVKEGDILANISNDAILIFKTIQNNYLFSSYCDYFVNTFRAKQFSQWASSAFIPATKEQSDFLFSEMKDAGYVWDDNKKEVRKIERKKRKEI